NKLEKNGLIHQLHTIKCDLYGSLALTGKGHGTDKAIILGLEGHTPEAIDSNSIQTTLDSVQSNKKIEINKAGSDCKWISFNPNHDSKFHRRLSLPSHPNGMAFAAFDKDNKELARDIFYAVGGGFIVTEEGARED